MLCEFHLQINKQTGNSTLLYSNYQKLHVQLWNNVYDITALGEIQGNFRVMQTKRDMFKCLNMH